MLYEGIIQLISDFKYCFYHPATHTAEARSHPFHSKLKKRRLVSEVPRRHPTTSEA